jgi:hypothetical protein
VQSTVLVAFFRRKDCKTRQKLAPAPGKALVEAKTAEECLDCALHVARRVQMVPVAALVLALETPKASAELNIAGPERLRWSGAYRM